MQADRNESLRTFCMGLSRGHTSYPRENDPTPLISKNFSYNTFHARTSSFLNHTQGT